MYSKICPKSIQSIFYLKGEVFKEHIESPYIWTNYKRNLDTKNFQKSPNLVTLRHNDHFCENFIIRFQLKSFFVVVKLTLSFFNL